MTPFQPARHSLGDRLYARLVGRLRDQLWWNLAEPLADHLRTLVRR